MIFGIIENKIFGGYYKLMKRYNLANKILKYIYRVIHKGYQYETGSYLPFNATILGPLNFPHGTYGIFISGDSIIGKNCTIFQQVTIGSNMLIDSKGLGAPTIGDNCIIGAGAKIIGKIKIGNNCRIGANSVVAENVQDNCTVVINKPILIFKKELDNKIYTMHTNGWGFIENGNFVLVKDPEILTKLNER